MDFIFYFKKTGLAKTGVAELLPLAQVEQKYHEKMVSVTSEGLYEFVLPFGLCNGPSTYEYFVSRHTLA